MRLQHYYPATAATLLIMLVALLASAQKDGLAPDTKAKLLKTIFKTSEVKDAPPDIGTEKIMTSNKYVWVMPNGTKPGHWRRARATEVTARAQTKASNQYPVGLSMDAYQAHMTPPATATGLFGLTVTSPTLPTLKPINLGIVSEDPKSFAQPITTKDFSGSENKINVYYAKRIELNKLVLSSGRSYVFVVDSLFVPVATGNNDILEVRGNNSPVSVKFIANCIVYESPIVVNARTNAHFIVSANKILFKTIYDDLKGSKKSFSWKHTDTRIRQSINGPPLFVTANSNGASTYKDGIGNEEKILLNRLYYYILADGLTELSFLTDEWKKDNLVEKLKAYKNLFAKDVLVTDQAYYQQLQREIDRFDAKYQDYQFQKVRKAGDNTILISKAATDGTGGKLRYHLFPTAAKLLPVVKDTSNLLLGSIRYKLQGSADLKLVIETELYPRHQDVENAQSFLLARGLNLSPQFPYGALTVKDQPLIIAGNNRGRIIPVGENILRLEFDLPEETRSLAEIFTQVQANKLSFNINFSVSGIPDLMETISLTADPSILSTLDYQKPLSSFDVIERTELFSDVKLVSSFQANREAEGVFDYAEVFLEFLFADRSVLRGPFRLSSYNTSASELLVPFLKFTPGYKIKVFGRVFYENGEQQLAPFETNDQVIQLNETKFKQ